MWYPWWSNSTNNLGRRLKAINSVSLISFHCATWTTETACAWGDTFVRNKSPPRPEINTRLLSLFLSYPPISSSTVPPILPILLLLLFLSSLPSPIWQCSRSCWPLPQIMLHLHPQLLTAGHAVTPEERRGGWDMLKNQITFAVHIWKLVHDMKFPEIFTRRVYLNQGLAV